MKREWQSWIFLWKKSLAHKWEEWTKSRVFLIDKDLMIESAVIPADGSEKEGDIKSVLFIKRLSHSLDP